MTFLADRPVPIPSLNGQAPVFKMTCEAELVTPQRAAEILKAGDYKWQRDLNRSHVEELAQAITRLEWEPTAIKLYECDGRQFLVDGQHRLNAIVEAGMAAPLIIIRQQTDNLNDVANAYRRIDIGFKRPPAVCLAGSGVHEDTGMGKTDLPKVIAALKVLMDGFMSHRGVGGRWKYRNTDLLTRGVYLWQNEANQYLRITDKATAHQRRLMLSAVVFAFAMVTLRDQNERAARFWEKVATKSGLGERTGEWHAVNVLVSEQLDKKARVARLLAACWNTAWKDETRIMVRASEDQFIKILGTVYNGRGVVRETFED
jgi:hypothetical protein